MTRSELRGVALSTASLQIAVDDDINHVLDIPDPRLALLSGGVAAFLAGGKDPLGCGARDSRRR
jgi:hypothetical protein